METKTMQGRQGILFIVMAACLLFGYGAGVRGIYGIVIKPLTALSGISYADAGFSFGIAQLMYGLTQPLWGALALRKGNRLVLLCGVLLMAAGLILTPLAHSVSSLTLYLGIILASGTGALSFGLVMGTISPILGPKRASAVSGILNASSGIGSAILSPVMQGLNSAVGIQEGLFILGGAMACLFPVVWWLCGLQKKAGISVAAETTAGEGRISIAENLKRAWRTWDYKALLIGFSTCGFHMVIIQTHLVPQMESLGIPGATAAMIYTGFGITSILGSILCGVLCLRFPLRTVLGTLYALRVVTVGVFIFLVPQTTIWLALFALLLGMTGDATVTPTSQIISNRFGAASMAFLFGLTFVCHQTGGFISSWLGGILYTQTGSYDMIWLADIILCAIAAAASYSIRK